MKKYLLLGLFIFFVGCSNNQQAITPEYLQNKTNMQLLDIADKLDKNEDENVELYFLDTKDKILYKQDLGSGLEYKVKYLLNQILIKLKHIKYISLEVSDNLKDKNRILTDAQEYILNSKKYTLTNTDKDTLKVLKKVLKHEKDAIYKGSAKFSFRHKSDVVIFISEDNNYLYAKAIAKNGAILAIAKVSKKDSKWVEVNVPKEGGYQVFEVMLEPVTSQEFYGYGGDKSVTNVAFSKADEYCQKKGGILIEPYVFEYARREFAIKRPKGADKEIIAPYDEEDQDIYYQQGDKIEGADETIILFDWNSEKYFSVSNLYKSQNATFRCMRSK